MSCVKDVHFRSSSLDHSLTCSCTPLNPMLRRTANGQGQKLGLSIELGERYTTYFHSFYLFLLFFFFLPFFPFLLFFFFFTHLFVHPPFCNLSTNRRRARSETRLLNHPRGRRARSHFLSFIVVFQILNQYFGTHTLNTPKQSMIHRMIHKDHKAYVLKRSLSFIN